MERKIGHSNWQYYKTRHNLDRLKVFTKQSVNEGESITYRILTERDRRTTVTHYAEPVWQLFLPEIAFELLS